jgi:flagellar hook-basal body complex protein FliE
VESLVPDITPGPSAQSAGANDFVRALDAVYNALTRANDAEDAFAYGSGTLANAVYERAQADVALSAATAATARFSQAVQSVLNMQV